MVISYATKSPVIQLAVTGNMAAEMYESLNSMINQDTAAIIRQPLTKVPDRRFAASDEEITISTPTGQESLLSQSVKTVQGSAARQQDPQFGTLQNKLASTQNWQSMVDLYLLEEKALKRETLKMFWTDKDLWSGRLESRKTTYHTIDLKKGTCPICQQPYQAGHKYRDVLLEHVEKQLEAG